jgi:hypothetical protein
VYSWAARIIGDYSELSEMPLPGMSIDRFSQLCFLILNRSGPSTCKDHIVADRTLGLYDSLVDHDRNDGFHLRHQQIIALDAHQPL